MKIKVKQEIYEKNINADYVKESYSVLDDINFAKEVNVIKVDCFDGVVNLKNTDE